MTLFNTSASAGSSFFKPIHQPPQGRQKHSDNGASGALLRFGEKTLEERAKRFADYHGRRIYDFMLEERDASWEYDQYGGAERLQKSEDFRKNVKRIWQNTRVFKLLQNFLAPETLEQIKDPVLKRTLQVMAEFMKPSPSTPTELEKMKEDLTVRGIKLQDYFNQFPQDSGTTIGLWTPPGEAKTYGELLKELIKDRNQYARLKGFQDYYSFSLNRQDFTDSAFTTLLTDMKTALATSYARNKDFLKSDAATQAIQNWEKTLLEYLRKQQPEEILRKTASLMGISAEGVIKNADFYIDPNRPDKTHHFFCNYGDLPHEIRPITNIPLNPEERQIWHYKNQLLHEGAGHGFDFQFIDPTLPPLLREFDHFSAEGQAITFESLINNRVWLEKVVGIPAEILDQPDQGRKLSQLQDNLTSLRWSIGLAELERKMYENPEQDFDELYMNQIADYYQKPAKEVWKVPGKWAEIMHFANYPAYLHNYVFGQAWRAQLEAHVNGELGGLLTPEAAQLLKDGRSSGKLYPWTEIIQKMTGAPLQADGFIKELRDLEAAVPPGQPERLQVEND